MKRKIHSLRGFTLLELIVVIAIIGVLSVLILPSFTTALAKSRDAKKISELNGLHKNLLLWAQNNNNRFPATQTMPTKSAGCNTTTASTSLCALVNGGITNRLPDGAFNGTGPGGVGSAYNYVGVACFNGGLCQGYQLWVDLEKTNASFSSDSDASSTATTSWRGIDWTAGGMILPTTANMVNGEIETCTGLANTCVFDFRP